MTAYVLGIDFGSTTGKAVILDDEGAVVASCVSQKGAVTKPVVLDGVHAAVAKRIVGLVARVGQRDPIVMTGGVARNVAAIKHIEEALKTRLIIPSHPQVAGALGAALFALDDLRQEGASRRQQDSKVEGEVDQLMAAGMACAPACAQKTTPITFKTRNPAAASVAH